MRACPPLALFTLCMLATAAGAQAQTMYYKWVDENGRVTYSDTPPVGNVRSKETITVQGAPASSAARQLNEQEAQFKKRQDDAVKAQADAAKKQEAERQKADNCSRARADLRALRDNVPMSRMTESGERVLLEGATRDAEARRLETYVEENCVQPG